MRFGKSGPKRELHSKSKLREDRELVRSGTDEFAQKAVHCRRMVHELLSEWYLYLSSKAIYVDQWSRVDWWEQRVPRDLSVLCRMMTQEMWWKSPTDFRTACQTVWAIHTSAEKVDEAPDTNRLHDLMVEFEEMICDE